MDHETTLVSILVATLAYSIRSSPPFPDSHHDLRSPLSLEILRVLFCLGSSPGIPPPSEETMTQIGILTTDILHLSRRDNRAYQVKCAVVNLLLQAPPDYAFFFAVNGGVEELLWILWLEMTGRVESRKDQQEAALLSVLIVLTNLAQANRNMREKISLFVFPQPLAAARERRLDPLDAPEFSLRKKLIGLLTSPRPHLKRIVSEFLWILCGEDSNVFVKRTGFGNAVHFLGMKGLVNLPSGVM